MPVKYYASQARGSDDILVLQRLVGEEVTIVVEAYSMTERGHWGNNQYFYSPPEVSQVTTKLLAVLNYGLLVEGGHGYDSRIEYQDGFQKVSVPAGQGYFPFGDSTTYFEGEKYSTAERAEIDRVTILSVSHKGEAVYREKSVFDDVPANYHRR